MWSSPVELVGPSLGGRVVLTCEHASAAVPPPWRISEGERRWLKTHWGYDPGAAALTRVLSRALGCPAVLSNFTRLLADPNRPPDHPDLCRQQVEGVSLELNRDLSDEERVARVVRLHAPFHGAVDALLAARCRAGIPTFLFSVHSFTPLYLGQRRSVELGVLFDASSGEGPTQDAGRMLRSLKRHGKWNVQANQPWSGMDGLVYSVARHGGRHGLRYLELEVRNDLLTGPDHGGEPDPVPVSEAGVREVAAAVVDALAEVLDAR